MTPQNRLTKHPRWLFSVPLLAFIAIVVFVPQSAGGGLVRTILYFAIFLATIPLARDLFRGIKEADPTLGKTPAEIRKMREEAASKEGPDSQTEHPGAPRT